MSRPFPSPAFAAASRRLDAAMNRLDDEVNRLRLIRRLVRPSLGFDLLGSARSEAGGSGPDGPSPNQRPSKHEPDPPA